MADYTIEPLAEDALLLRFGHAIDRSTNAQVHAAARALRIAALRGVTDIVPAYASLLLRFDPLVWENCAALRHALPGVLHTLDRTTAGAVASPSTITIPVCYGGAYGPDLAAVAAHTRLTEDQIIARHTGVEYTVAMLGFAPGFPYLLGLDPALHMPRRADPRTRVAAGSVGIGGAQTGIYPRELPGGWQLIGRTPLVLFDADREPPCLLAPGDRVRFRAISDSEFGAPQGRPARQPFATDPRAHP